MWSVQLHSRVSARGQIAVYSISVLFGLVCSLCCVCYAEDPISAVSGQGQYKVDESSAYQSRHFFWSRFPAAEAMRRDASIPMPLLNFK